MSNTLLEQSSFNLPLRKVAGPTILAALAAATIALVGAPACATTITSYVVTSATKPYIAVINGSTYSPYLMYGVQLRLDQLLGSYYTPGTTWPMPYSGTDGADYYFQAAANVGFKTVVVPVPWKYVDYSSSASNPSYNFEYVHKIINSAIAANTNLPGNPSRALKVQLLWYGSDVCGYSEAPSYVNTNHTTYPLNPSNSNFLDLSNANLISVETNALTAMMNDVASYDATNCVVALQVENEPDGCGPVESQLIWGNAASMSSLMYAGGQYTAVNNLVNNLAVAVKASSWKGVTRVNIGSAYRSIDMDNYRAGLSSGIDIFGVDLYTSNLTSIHNTLAELAPPTLFSELVPTPSIDPLTSTTSGARSSFAGNVTYQPEGGGQYGDYVCLALSNFADGGGALIYELRTLQAWQSGGVWQPVYDLGIYRRTTTSTQTTTGTWTSRDGSMNVPYNLDGTNLQAENKTSDIVTFNGTIYDADQKIAVANPTNCAAYLQGGTGGTIQSASPGGTSIKFQTWNNGDGFAMKDTNGDLILLNFTAGNDFTIDPAYPVSTQTGAISAGYYDSTNTWHQSYTKSFNSGTTTLVCWAGECIRIIHK